MKSNEIKCPRCGAVEVYCPESMPKYPQDNPGFCPECLWLRKPDLWAIVEKHGEGGVGGQYMDKDGHETTVTTYSAREEHYFCRLKNGGVFLDLSVLRSHPEFPSWVINGPLMSLKVGKGSVDRCPAPDPILAGALQGSFGAMAQRKVREPRWSGLDTIGLEDYVELWRSRGARTAIREGHEMLWPDGSRTEILRIER